MRIIGGTLGGNLLKVPKGYDVRPTPDLVRQALFNSLGNRVAHTRVLELFAGTGALSLECLSRGAIHALCIEKTHRHAEILRRNAESLGVTHDQLSVRVQDAFVALHQLAASHHRFDLVLADPPYGEKNLGRKSNSAAQKLLDDPALPSLLAEGGLFVLGHARRDTLTLPSQWTESKTLRHGDSVMRLLLPHRASAAGQPVPRAVLSLP
jgi:16S rRNA (guanine966-N2)-methyltransferase